MTVATIITLVRIGLVPVFIGAFEAGSQWSWLTLAIFIVASFTDAVDGYVARRYNQVTNLGKIVDPLADKLLVTSALLMLVQAGQMSAIAAIIIIAREFLITSLRTVAVADGCVIAAGPSGKIKTVVQIVCISLLLTDWGDTTLFAGITLHRVAIWIMVLVTVWSGVVYMVEHKDVWKAPVKKET